MSDSLWPHGLQYARLSCSSPSPRACSNSCLSSWWCHPTISSYVIPFSSGFLFFPVSRSFSGIQLFPSGGQSIGASVSASVLPVNIWSWFPLGWTGLILHSPRDSQESYPAPQFKSINYLMFGLLYGPTLKAMTNLDSVLKSRDIALTTKVYNVKAIVFPVVMYIYKYIYFTHLYPFIYQWMLVSISWLL